MASKKFEELSAMNDEELRNELKETEAYLKKNRFDHAIKGSDNPILLRNVRRDIARINTEIRRREIAAMSEEELAARTRIRNRRRNN